MILPGVLLAPDAPTDDVDCILMSREPEKAMPERLGDQVASADMVAAISRVDLMKDAPSLFRLDATEENSRCAAFVELVVDDGVS